jgi:hypothetical protein
MGPRRSDFGRCNEAYRSLNQLNLEMTLTRIGHEPFGTTISGTVSRQKYKTLRPYCFAFCAPLVQLFSLNHPETKKTNRILVLRYPLFFLSFFSLRAGLLPFSSRPLCSQRSRNEFAILFVPIPHLHERTIMPALRTRDTQPRCEPS